MWISEHRCPPGSSAQRSASPPALSVCKNMTGVVSAVGCMPLFYERAVKRKNNSTVLPTFSSKASPTPHPSARYFRRHALLPGLCSALSSRSIRERPVACTYQKVLTMVLSEPSWSFRSTTNDENVRHPVYYSVGLWCSAGRRSLVPRARI